MAGIKFAQNWDNAAGLTLLSPQPHWDGLQPGDLRHSPTLAYNAAAWVAEWEFVVLWSEYATLLTTFGLSARNTFKAKGTFAVPDYDGATVNNWNGFIIKPDSIRSGNKAIVKPTFSIILVEAL